MSGLPRGLGLQFSLSAYSEWGSGPRRDEQGDLHRLLSSGDAACAGDVVRDRWMGDMRAGGAEGAAALCKTCPIRRDCLAYALVYDVAGIWGGTTATQRRAMRAGRRPIPLTAREDH